jgi:hypothetical protein
VPPLPLDIVDNKLRITLAIEAVERSMLERVRNELDYIPDMCRVTSLSHNTAFRVCHSMALVTTV